ncbi:putative bacitracin ABC transporter, ATP-binding protein BcrA [Streptococcus parauberis NCFD 2020]|nr:putative bacitracin ABC transporter, ATP-binding protein BcrA [Streptococcus parauberis NCFD 2020]
MNQALIDIQNITKYYNKRITLNDLSFTVHKGEICGLVGENGAGKTTLIRIIAGLIKSDGGVIDKSKIKNLSCIIESPAFYPNLSAYDNLKYHMLRLGFPKSNKKIDEILNLVGLK